MRLRYAATVIVSCLLGAPALAMPPGGETTGVACKRLPDTAIIPFDVDALSLADFTRILSCVTGERFLLVSDPAGQVRILSPDPMTVAELRQAFHIALDASGLAAVRRGKFTRIVAKTRAASGTPIRGRVAPDTWVTEFLSVGRLDPKQAVVLARHFASDGADVTLHEPTRTLVVTDSARNVRRLKSALGSLAQSSTPPVVIVRPLRSSLPSADAARLVDAVGEHLGGPLRAVSEPRTNQLVLVGSRTAADRAHRLLRRLESRPRSDTQSWVIRLENASASDIAPLLETLFAD